MYFASSSFGVAPLVGRLVVPNASVSQAAQPFHLVQPSPWPLDTSIVLGSLAFLLSATFWLGDGYHSASSLAFGGVFLVAVSAAWWRDVIIEGTFLGDHTSDVQRGLVLGMGLFIVTEIMVFFAIFWGYFHSALSPVVELGGAWPPAGITAMDPLALPLLNTVLLLSSGATVTFGHHSLVGRGRDGVLLGLALTILMAAVFTYFQGIEYAFASFTLVDGVYGSTFYRATGVHGFHVIIGTLFIGVGLWRVYGYHVTAEHHVGLQNSIVYWHMVDVVWIFLFACLYWWAAA